MRFNRVIYLALLAVAAIFTIVSGMAVSYAILYVLILLPVFTFAMAFFSRRNFSVSQSLDKDEVFKGETVDYRLLLRNRGIFFFPHIQLSFPNIYGNAVAIDKTEQAKREFGLAPRSEHSRSFKLYCAYRGRYEFGIDSICVYDALGLFKFNKIMREKIGFTVYPLIREVTDFPFSVLHVTESSSAFDKRDEDYSIVSDLKKYESSDSIKKIHWKLSAKKSELLVKKFQANTINTTLLLLDNAETSGLMPDRLVLEDMICEDAASVLNFCFLRKYPVEFSYTGTDGREKGVVMTKGGESGFHELYKVVAGIRFAGNNDFCGVIDQKASQLKDSANIILFTHRLDERVYEMLRSVKVLGNSVIMFCYDRSDSPKCRALRTNLLDSNINVFFREIYHE